MELTEDFVSFELAKLLRKKGFDGYCFMIYSIDGTIDNTMELYGEVSMCNSECSDGDIVAPTFQMAIKYLREQYGFLISINPTLDKDGQLCIMYYIWDMDDIEKEAVKSGLYSIENYNQCIDDSIKYCLENLI